MPSEPPRTPERTRPPSECAKQEPTRPLEGETTTRRKTSVEIPEPLRASDESADEDDLPSESPPMFMNMNQSIFGLIAAAGSRVDFNGRFDEISSSDEEGGSGSGSSAGKKNKAGKGRAHKDWREDLSQTTILQPRKESQRHKGGYKWPISGNKLLSSLPALPKLGYKSRSSPAKLPVQPEEDEEEEDKGSGSVSSADLNKAAKSLFFGNSQAPALKLSISRENTASREPPILSRMIEAQAEMESRPSFDLPPEDLSQSRTLSPGGDKEATPLAKRLQEIFEYDEPEPVVGEYPCWLLQSVLLQGYLYITAKHICFYAFLPKKAVSSPFQYRSISRVHDADSIQNTVAKSGFLSKSGKRNPKYNRFWFRLKGDILSYYRDSTNVYFPHGQIDLSYGISANITDKEKEGVHFEVVTRHRTYNFRADSGPSAKEWVKSLQRVIFRSHNDGDSVKISLPIANVIDVEETQMIEFADTCKIRVIDNDETFAIDEYFFSFFSFGKEAIGALKVLIEDDSSPARRELSNAETTETEGATRPLSGVSSPGSYIAGRIHPPKLPETVKATLSPLSPASPRGHSPRGSEDMGRRHSSDGHKLGGRSLELSGAFHDEGRARRSFSGSRRSSSRRRLDDDKKGQQPFGASSESYVQSSMEDPSISNLAASSIEDASASQILRNSQVFHQNLTHMRSSSGDSKGKAAVHDRHQPPELTTQSTERPAEDDSATAPAQSSLPTLQNIGKFGAYPLQRAGMFAGYLNKTRQKMGTLLASESMGYVEKVSGMWKGGRKHYDEPDGLKIDDDDDLERDADGNWHTSNERFRAHFALPETEKLQATYFGYILRVLPLYGKIYLSDRTFCFRSLLPGTRTKLILPLHDIENVNKEKGFRFGYSGLVVVIKGHEEIFFEFGQAELRDDCAITLLRGLEATRYLKEAGLLNQEDEEGEDSAVAERDALKSATHDEFPEHELKLPRRTTAMSGELPMLGESDTLSMNFKPKNSMRITCLTIGSRGDVQPYIALCKGLLAQGHKPRIATHAEFQGWIESHGIEFAPVAGDPGELMRLCIENGTFTWAFLREANSTFRGWLDELLNSAAEACEGSELLIESPSAMAGIHIAEQLGIPYFRAFTMPWTRTRAYPHAFIMPEQKLGGAYNYMTYVMFDNIYWKAIAHQVNKWRNNKLGLPNTSLEKLQPNKVPFLYNFSPSVVAPPLDFSDWIRITGYWFLNEGDNYQPPEELTAFIKKARDDGKKIVYVGFGSIIVNDPAKMTQEVIDAVLKADVRCILSKGWSERISSKAAAAEEAKDPLEKDQEKPPTPEPVMPPEIHVIKSAPHDWLFSQIDAAAHHGGSGTTGASLRAGIPTIIRPFFGDQYFFASRVEDLGVGVWVKKWGTNSFGRALFEATRSERMIAKARVLGEEIRSVSSVPAGRPSG